LLRGGGRGKGWWLAVLSSWKVDRRDFRGREDGHQDFNIRLEPLKNLKSGEFNRFRK